MPLFLSANLHQGDERSNVRSKGKQCAFTSLSAVLNNSPKYSIVQLVKNNIYYNNFSGHCDVFCGL